MVSEFQRAFTVQDVVRQLRERAMKSDETPRQYVVEMQYIASRADVAEIDLIDIIVEGLNDKTPLVSMLYGATTIKQLKLLMERYEKKRRNQMPVSAAVSMQAKSTGAVPKQKSIGSVATVNNNASVDISTVRCYNCFAYGHYQSACTQPKRPMGSCFICSELGHNHHNCPKKKKLTSEQITSAVAAALQSADNDGEDAEVQRLAKKLAHHNLVSIAFVKQNKCTDLISRFALFDSGSPVSTIQKSLVPFVANDDQILTKFRGMGNKQLSMCGFVKCKFVFRDHVLMHYFLILPDEEAAVPLLVGRDLLKKMNIHLCQIEKTKYSINEILNLNKENKAQLLPEKVVSALKLFDLFIDLECNDTEAPFKKQKPNTNCNTEVNINCKSDPGVNLKNILVSNENKTVVHCNLDSEVNLLKDIVSCETRFKSCVGVVNLVETEDLMDYDEVILMVNATEIDEQMELIDIDKQLEQSEVEALKSVVYNNYVKLSDETQKLTGYSMQIKLKSDTPVYSSPRRLSYKEKLEVQKTINELLVQGIIRQSNSPYASSIVLVRKKNGELRMCVGYRALNKLTVKDRYPLPLIENCLEYLGGKKYFSVLDLKSGFHQVPMHEESIRLTAFVTPMGQ